MKPLEITEAPFGSPSPRATRYQPISKSSYTASSVAEIVVPDGLSSSIGAVTVGSLNHIEWLYTWTEPRLNFLATQN